MPLAEAIRFLADLPAQLSSSERLFLYSSVLSFRPTSCLEIGSYMGGSTTIISLALDQLGQGHLFSIDPCHGISDGDFQKIVHRTTLIHGCSPAAVTDAYANTQRFFDFVFVDGNHNLVEQDCEGIYPFLASEALVLFHDAQYRTVRAAVDKWLKKHSGQMLDHGIVDKSCNTRYRPPELYGGIRAVTYRRPTWLVEKCRHQPGSPDAAWRCFL